MSRPVLLLRLGEAPEPVRAVHGPFASWYERAFGAPLAVLDGRADRLPDPRDYAGILVTGSASSLVRPEPWMDDAAAFVVAAHDAGVAVLGVCFGHQLVGHAFGRPIVPNPRGWEVGTHEATLTRDGREDWLFAGLPDTLRVNLVHEDMVEPAASDGTVRLLAESALTPALALAVGEHVRGVQFHPEVSGAIVRGYIGARRALLQRQDPEALLATARDTPDGIAVLRNFRRLVEMA